ncbi:MAG: hypothetical protein HZC41_07435 [Chloroflexi bacterium]|nr:hypothetical protein [Chloroflexota bacterium]
MPKVRWQIYMLLACLLALVGTQVMAQETTPAPEETLVVVPIEETVIPTDVPTEAPTATPVIETTPEVTVEPPPEQTVEPPIPPTVTPVVPGLPPEPVLALLVREMFDTGDLSNWFYGPAWSLAANDTGLNLQTAAGDVLQLNRGPFINAAAQISLKLTGGSVHLALRQSAVGSYSAALDATGLLTLYRAGVPVQSVVVPLLPEGWQTLRLSVMDGVLRVAVNGVEALAWQDSAPLPPGMMAVLAYPPADGQPFSVQVDDAFVWVPEADVPLYPPPTLTPVPLTPEPTAIVTAEPTADVTVVPTAEVTAEPTAEITPIVEPTEEGTPEATIEPTKEATPVIDPVTGKSLTAVQYIPPPGAQITASDNPGDVSTPISSLPYFEGGDTSGNAPNAGNPTAESNFTITCGFNITATTWFKFTPALTKQYVLTSVGSSFDTILVVYPDNGSGTTLANNPITGGCNDDVSTTNLTSKLSLTLTGGQTYWIRLGGYNGVAGQYEFRLQEANLPVPRPPTLLSPANGFLTDTRAFELTWAAPAPVTGLPTPTAYEVQVARSTTFASPLAFTAIVNHPTMAVFLPTDPPEAILTDGKYYWRVRSINVNGVGGSWTTYRSFTIDSTAPLPPVLTLPVNDGTSSSPRPTLTWKAVTGANKYRVTLTDVSADPDVILVPNRIVTTPSLALSTAVLLQPLQHGKTYEWYVAAGDAAGNWSPNSVTWNFTVNLMNAPVNGAAVVAPDGRPTFTWYAAGFTGAQYVLEVNITNDFSGAVMYTSPVLTTASHKITTALPAATPRYYWRLRVLNHMGTLPTTLPVRSFVLTTAIPPTVTLLTPTNAKVLKDQPVPFTWRAVAATAPNQPFTYQLQVGTDRTFAVGIVNDQTTGEGVVNATATLDPGVYFWRVRALNNVGAPGLWSSVWSFTVDRTGPTVPPTLKSPTDLSITNLVRPTLMWNAVTGAVRYRVHLQEQGTATQLLLPNKDMVTTTSLALSTLVMQNPLQHGKTYEWYVFAQDVAGNESAASDTWEFTVNLMNAPADNIGIRVLAFPGSPSFTWYSAGVTGATYRVEVSTSESDFTGAKSCTSAALSCLLAGDQRLTGPNTYYWRLLVLVAGTPQTTDVPVRSFVASTTLPGTPVLTSPTTGTAFNTAPKLKWSGPTGGPFSYQVQLANNSTFTLNPTIEDVPTGFEFTPAGLTDGLTYWWRVRAVNGDGAAGTWSAYRTFIYDTTAPTNVPTLLTPANRSSFTGPLPRFTWRAVTGFTRYEIQLVTTGDCLEDPALSFRVATTSFTPPGPLLYTSYRWCVRVLDAAGNGGPWSDSFEVKIVSASTAVPVLNRFQDNTPTLIWTPISWADQYEVQISYNSSFTSLVPGYPAFVPGTPGPEPPTSFTVPTALPDGTYYWRVRAHDPGSVVAPVRAARWGAWSTGGTGSFQVDTTP